MQTCVTNLHHHVTKDVLEWKYNLMKHYNSINLKMIKRLTDNICEKPSGQYLGLIVMSH
jgi:hypothetical protein